MARKNVLGPAMSALSAGERAEILATLLKAHPELIAEAEEAARTMLAGEDHEQVAACIADELRGLRLQDLAERSGAQWGGGYVDPHEAAWEMVAEVVQPYLDDLSRRAQVGAGPAALEIGMGLLVGLHSCRRETDNDLAIVHAGLPDVLDHQADRVFDTLDRIELKLPDGWTDEHCPAWM